MTQSKSRVCFGWVRLFLFLEAGMRCFWEGLGESLQGLTHKRETDYKNDASCWQCPHFSPAEHHRKVSLEPRTSTPLWIGRRKHTLCSFILRLSEASWTASAITGSFSVREGSVCGGNAAHAHSHEYWYSHPTRPERRTQVSVSTPGSQSFFHSNYQLKHYQRPIISGYGYWIGRLKDTFKIQFCHDICSTTCMQCV